MILSLSLRPEAARDLDHLLVELHDPASPNYHRWLTPEEFGARFGRSESELRSVLDWLEDRGFRVDEVAKGRGWINFSGTAAQVEAAFGTEIHDYTVGGKVHHANATEPLIPPSLAGFVNGVVSLHDFRRKPLSAAARLVSLAGRTPDLTNAGSHYLGPADFATIYNLKPLYGAGNSGTGRTIAIVGRSDIALADVQAFRNDFGLSPNDPVLVHNGTAPGRLGGGEEIEADLDVQWAGAVAPQATLKFVISQSTATTDGVDLSAQYIVNNNLADVMSTSFGACESAMGSNELAFYNALWSQAATQGITSFVASGDSGAAGCSVGSDPSGSGRAVSGLCSTPHNVCVGGSQFDDVANPGAYWSSSNDPATQQSALSYIPEIAWNESGTVPGGSGLWSSGGGASGVYAKPSWQAAPGVPADGMRDVPDVALTSAGHDGYLVRQGGSLYVVSGTSAASPAFAGIMALIAQRVNARQGNANPVLYRLGADQYAASGSAVFHDVTSGSNTVPGVSGFSSGTGYDLVTGLGTANAQAMVAGFALPRISVGDVMLAEGNSGVSQATFQLSLSRPSNTTVTVRYATANGTAVAPGDYQATSGTLSFAPGVTTATVGVNVNGDTLYELDETFFLNLSAPSGATVADGRGQATILNDDAPPAVSIGDVAVTEGNSSTKLAVFTVSLSTVSGAPASVGFATQDGTATGATGAGQDYRPAAGVLTILAGKLTGTIAVSIKGDAVIEPDETFFVNLSGPVGATIADGQGQGTIVNDDVPGSLQFGAANFAVGEGGYATIKVVRIGGNATGTTVDYTTVDGSATQPADYTSTQGTLTFGANVAAAIFKVPIVSDTLREGPETVLLSLGNPQPAGFGAALGVQRTAVLTITDNDLPGTIQFAPAAYKVDASAAATSVVVTVRRSGGLASPVTVHYASSDGTATAGVDYTATAGDLTFQPSGTGATVQTIVVPVARNTQGAKNLRLTLSAPGSGATLGSLTTASVTILGAQPTVSFSSNAYTATLPRTAAVITVARSAPLTGTVIVPYATSAGSATPGADYSDVSGTLTFGAGVATRNFSVPLAPNPYVARPKTVNLTLGSPTWSGGAAVLDPALGASTLTILDPNLAPSVQFSATAYTVNEATAKATITVKRGGDLAGTVTVDYAATGGTAANGVDYTLAPGTLSFGQNQVVQTFSIPILNDSAVEGTETVNLGLSNPTWTGGAAVLGAAGTAVLSITDNEPTVQFSAAAYTAAELARPVTITVRRTGSLTAAATVLYTTSDGTATSTGPAPDYTASAGTLTFAPGQSSQTFAVMLNADTVADGSKTVHLTLSGPGNAALGTPETAVLTIKDNDLAGKVQFSARDFSVSEMAGSATITVSRTGGTSSAATVAWATADGSAVAGTDYTSSIGTLTFGLNEKTRTFSVPILDDGMPNAGSARTVQLSLGPTGGGLGLGSPATATLWIVKQ